MGQQLTIERRKNVSEIKMSAPHDDAQEQYPHSIIRCACSLFRSHKWFFKWKHRLLVHRVGLTKRMRLNKCDRGKEKHIDGDSKQVHENKINIMKNLTIPKVLLPSAMNRHSFNSINDTMCISVEMEFNANDASVLFAIKSTILEPYFIEAQLFVPRVFSSSYKL